MGVSEIDPQARDSSVTSAEMRKNRQKSMVPRGSLPDGPLLEDVPRWEASCLANRLVGRKSDCRAEVIHGGTAVKENNFRPKLNARFAVQDQGLNPHSGNFPTVGKLSVTSREFTRLKRPPGFGSRRSIPFRSLRSPLDQRQSASGDTSTAVA